MPIMKRAGSLPKIEGIASDRCYESVDALIKSELACLQTNVLRWYQLSHRMHLHYSFARSLLNVGFHLVCEKPMTMTVQEALDLEELVAKNRTYFCPDSYIYRISNGPADEGSYRKRSTWYHSAY